MIRIKCLRSTLGEAPRRSTSSLEAVLDTGIALVYRIGYEQFGGQRFS